MIIKSWRNVNVNLMQIALQFIIKQFISSYSHGSKNSGLKLHLAYVLRWNRGKNIYFFSHM